MFHGKHTNPAPEIICAVCRNPADWDGNPMAGWFHPHSGAIECGTGDGSVAYPQHLWDERQRELALREKM